MNILKLTTMIVAVAGTLAACAGPAKALTTFGEEIPVVSAMSPGEVSSLRSDTLPLALAPALPELDSGGNPALYYAMVGLRSRLQLRALSDLGIYYDKVPLFEEELESLIAAQGLSQAMVTAPRDENGTFVYALVSGLAYNELRRSAQAGTIIFDTVSLRTIPNLAARDGGLPNRVSYDFLRSQDFSYTIDDEAVEAEIPPAETNPGHEAAVASIASVVTSEVSRTRSLLNATPFLFGDRVNVFVRLKVLNTDPRFVDPRLTNGTPVPRMMRQAWGPRRGGPIGLDQMKIYAKRGLAIYSARLNLRNEAVVRVPKNKEVRWCIKLKTRGAVITHDALFADDMCDFDAGLYMYNADANEELSVRHPRVNMLSQAEDGYQYLVEIVQHTPKRAHLLVGPIANLISVDGIPYALCGAYYDLLVNTLANLVGLIFPPGELVVEVIGRSDLVLPDAPYVSSRGVTAHEYGHFAFCSLLHEADPVDFEAFWTQVTFQTLLPQADGGERGVEHEASWFVEGSADFFASQTAHGVNYFRPSNAFGSGDMVYCNGNSDDCMESNRDGGPLLSCTESRAGVMRFPDFGAALPLACDALYRQSVAAMAALLSDFFDGHVGSGANAPTNGGAWVPVRVDVDGVEEMPRRSPRQNDEVVRLFGHALKDLARELLSGVQLGLSKEDFFSALTRTARAHGWNDSQICRVFSLHSHSDTCLSLIPGNNLDLNPALVALELGDLLKPEVLTCYSPQSPSLRCSWEDTSIEATAHRFRVIRTDTGQVLLQGSLPPKLVVREHEFTLPTGFVGTVRIAVEIEKNLRRSPPASTVVQIPPPPPANCGNGVIDPGEVCEEDTAFRSKCGVGICFTVRTCLECQRIVAECICS